MKHFLLTLGIFSLALSTAWCAGGFFDSFAIANGAFYDLSANTGNTDFNGANLGNFDSSTGTLLLGGQIKTFKNNGTDITGVTIFYRFYQGAPTGAFTPISYSFQWNQSDAGAPGNLNNAGDQQWGTDVQGANATDDAVDILNGTSLANGTYTLQVYVQVNTNGVDEAGALFDSNGGSNYAATFTITGAMPVDFSNIAAKATSKGNDLTFSTATETNNAYFDIQRSHDSRNWENIGKLTGAGTTLQAQHYLFSDESPKSGLNYYRVKQVDFDGAFSYSNIVSARWTGKFQVLLSPNPASDLLQINGLPEDGEIMTLEIMNAAGQILLQQQSTQNTIDVSRLVDGIYFLRVRSASAIVAQQRLFIH